MPCTVLGIGDLMMNIESFMLKEISAGERNGQDDNRQRKHQEQNLFAHTEPTSGT